MCLVLCCCVFLFLFRCCFQLLASLLRLHWIQERFILRMFDGTACSCSSLSCTWTASSWLHGKTGIPVHVGPFWNTDSVHALPTRHLGWGLDMTLYFEMGWWSGYYAGLSLHWQVAGYFGWQRCIINQNLFLGQRVSRWRRSGSSETRNVASSPRCNPESNRIRPCLLSNTMG